MKRATGGPTGAGIVALDIAELAVGQWLGGARGHHVGGPPLPAPEVAQQRAEGPAGA